MSFEITPIKSLTDLAQAMSVRLAAQERERGNDAEREEDEEIAQGEEGREANQRSHRR